MIFNHGFIILIHQIKLLGLHVSKCNQLLLSNSYIDENIVKERSLDSEITMTYKHGVVLVLLILFYIYLLCLYLLHLLLYFLYFTLFCI